MSYARCCELFRAGILDVLEHCIPQLRAIVGDGQGMFAINGVALGVLPWFGQAVLAFRVQADSKIGGYGGWQHFDDFEFLCLEHGGPLGAAALFAREVLENPPEGLDGQQLAHLIFLASAEALMSEAFRSRFYAILDSIQGESTFSGQFSFDNSYSADDGWFQYFVFDADGTCRANYCDIVRANLVTQVALPLWR